MTDYLRQPAFLIGEIDMNVNLSQPPASGEEYIKRVVIEAQQCADVVVADIDQTRLRNPTIDVEPDFLVSMSTSKVLGNEVKAWLRFQRSGGCLEAPSWLSPTLDWQLCQVSDFSHVRLYVSQLKSEILTAKRKWRPSQIDLPSMDDEKGWIEFCSNREERTKILPTLNTVFCLSQPMVEQILEYLAEHVAAQKKIEYELGQWIYALLVVLEMPLTPDACSCLRTLARMCSVIRASSENLEVHQTRALNLFICLVARYFRQLDLADP